MDLKTDEPNDQAKELRSIIEELEEGHDQYNNDRIDDSQDTQEKREVDILNLPPRKEVHTKGKRIRLKVSRYLFRFLFVLFLLIITLIGAYYF